MSNNEELQKIMEKLNLPNYDIYYKWVADHFSYCELANSNYSSKNLFDLKSGIKYDVMGGYPINPSVTAQELTKMDNSVIKNTFGILIENEYQANYMYATYFKNGCLVIEKTGISYDESYDQPSAMTQCSVYDREKSNIIVSILKKNTEAYIAKNSHYNLDLGLETYSSSIMYAASEAKNTWNLIPDAELNGKYTDVMQQVNEKIGELNSPEYQQNIIK